MGLYAFQIANAYGCLSEPNTIKLKRILIISSEFPPGPGGIGQHAFSLSSALGKKYSVQVLCNQDYCTNKEQNDFNQKYSSRFNIIRFKDTASIFKSILRSWQLLSVIRSYRPDVVIASGRFPLWLGGLLKLVRSRQFVVGFAHGSEISPHGGFVSSITSFFYQKLDLIIAVSNYTRDLLSDSLSSSKVKVVPNGLDPETLNLQLEVSEKFKGQPSILTVGNVTPRKGQHRVIKALPTILKNHPNAQYHIVGLPTHSKEILELAKTLGVEHHVNIHGRIDEHEELLKVYKKADIFIMLSENQPNGDIEGFGIAILEANAFGMPAIGAKGCGIEDAISDDTGVLVNGNNHEMISLAINKVLDNYSNYSKASLSWAKKHNWDVLVTKIITEDHSISK